VISPTQRPLPDNTQHSQDRDFHASGGTRTHKPSKRTAADPRLSRAATGIGCKWFVSLPDPPDWLWSQGKLLFNWYRLCLSEAKRPGNKFDHLPPSKAEVKNEQTYFWSPPPLPVCLLGVDNENFTFIFSLITYPWIVNFSFDNSNVQTRQTVMLNIYTSRYIIV
jgi:hypothetical protein